MSETFSIVTALADDIGARPCGSDNAARAVKWTTDKFASWGIDVHNERVVVPHWVRGAERAAIVSHNDQPLVLTALGGSVSAEISADVVERTSLDLGPDVAGKIVYFHNPMGSGNAFDAYRDAVVFRIEGAHRAAMHGAVAVLIHSVGSASLRTPHTGSMTPATIPAAALAAEDALLVHRLIARGDRVRIHLALESTMLADVESANVVAEIRGIENPDEIVLLGAHLDSWDLGTGAIDNASGVAMVMEAMRVIREPQKRTIRCVLFMNEELGQSGSHAYFAAHGHETHVAAIESDLGAGAPVAFTTTLRGDALSALRRVAPLPLIEAGDTGVDTRPLVEAGVPGFGYSPDLTHYFDYHHSAADMLDKVNAMYLEEGARAITALARLLANDKSAVGGRASRRENGYRRLPTADRRLLR